MLQSTPVDGPLEKAQNRTNGQFKYKSERNETEDSNQLLLKVIVKMN